jgi:hypothetical protein
VAVSVSLAAAELKFQHYYIDRSLPVDQAGRGNYGHTALVDVDRDADLDFVVGRSGSGANNVVYWCEFQGPDRWVKHLVGYDSQSEVGLVALDVDRDGWMDLVCCGVWFRNTGKPRQEPFQRLVFDGKAGGAHDILAADMDGNGKPDVVMMGDERTGLNSLRWYLVPDNPAHPWVAHHIGPPVHGAITPAGASDVDGDGDLDIIRADTWYENKDGRGREWVPHQNIPFGRRGPYGVCVRCAVADMDGDGNKEVVMGDADIVDSKVAILKNLGGKGLNWAKQELPTSFTYGSLHSLFVGDFNNDGRPDVLVNEQEELLPPGRENPRWVIWENLGQGLYVERIILDARLGGHELQAGDVDGDGDLDICSKPWGPLPWNANQGKMHADFLENLLKSR